MHVKNGGKNLQNMLKSAAELGTSEHAYKIRLTLDASESTIDVGVNWVGKDSLK